MERACGWLYRRLGRRYLAAMAAIELVSAWLIALGALGILRLYVEMSGAQFLRILLFTDLCATFAIAYGAWRLRDAIEPLRRWVIGDREGLDPAAVWCATVALPIRLVRRGDKRTILQVAVPVSVFVTVELGLPFYSAAFLLLGSLVAMSYSAVLHLFAGETLLMPIVRELSDRLPAGLNPGRVGVPLRWKLLGALPLINVITGVVVSGLSADQRASLEDLGLSVVVAVLVAFTISLELTVLVSRSILRPVRELLDATERVKEGDLSVRVPVTSGDELGALALSFNDMIGGLAEREALREAFGSYVDPQVARRVMEEGTHLEGEETEVTLLFVDIRDFTAFAEQASAREVVAYVNGFLELVVPTLTEHGGHANKVVGDGLLGVFGAPVRLRDHADRGVAAAREIAAKVHRRSDDRLRIGIGVNSGPVVAGIGGGGKLDFTVIGDAVNVSARVEKITRETSDPLKGRHDPVRIFSLVDERPKMVQTRTEASTGMASWPTR